MNYSIFKPELACDADGCVIDVRSLFARFEQLHDGRDRRGGRYPLPVVLTVYTLAKLAGEDEPAGIAAWAQLRQAWLAEVFNLKRACMPHATTFTRIFEQAISLPELQRVLSEFLAEAPSAQRSVVVTIDGKRLRGQYPTGPGNGGLSVGGLPAGSGGGRDASRSGAASK